ncbi:MAG: glycosyltransferase family 1 protein [Chloroflexota bacterium]
MHIGIDARLTHYRTGGISTYIRHLVWELEKLDQQNDYTVFHSRKAGAAKTIPQRGTRANLWTPAHHRIERTALSVEIARFGLDVFHSPDFIPPRRGARRHVITVHDLTFLHYPQFLTSQSRRYYNAQIHGAVRHADHILTISQSSHDDIVNMLGVPPEKISIHLLAAEDNFTPQSSDVVAQMRRELDLPAEYVLFVGTLEPRKNIDGLLTAYRQLLQSLPDAPALVLAGNRGWLLDDTLHEIESMQRHGRVIWREKIPQQWMPALYSGATAHVMPSFYEGFGLPALEAMACGTVPIVSNRSSLPEVVGDVGLQIDPESPEDMAQAMYTALTDATWRTQQEQAGIERAAQFSWQDAAQVTLAAYRKVMS